VLDWQNASTINSVVVKVKVMWQVSYYDLTSKTLSTTNYASFAEAIERYRLVPRAVHNLKVRKVSVH
jgi:hypothetical protein